MSIYANAEHGIVCSMPDRYFGWPSVAKLEDGTIVAGCSGLRRAHVCPWGKSVVFYSTDGGKTYGEPQIVHDDMIDNRDLGITAMGGQKYGITWFALDTRRYNLDECLAPEDVAEGKQLVASWPDEEVKRLQGGWLKLTEDGGKTWSDPIVAPVSAPHGFVALADGTLGFLGRGYPEDRAVSNDTTQYHISRDGGKTWIYMGDVTVEDEMVDNYCEPHLIELKDGSLMGALRFHPPGEETYDTALTFSRDGGKTWTYPRRL